MLNSKMKRSMAWIMSAAVIMSAAPVSAADFTAEADVEVTAEAADAGAEENTDAPEAEAEEDGGFGSGEMISEENTAEAGSDETGLTDEENAGDESADFMDGFSDGSAEEESSDISDEFTDEGMSTEELVQAFAEAGTEDPAPWSSVDSLPAGTYENVTANLYVPGAQNKILGVNAYLNNPADPVGMSGVFGVPTDPVYNDASMVIDENGKITLTLELKNQVFELLQVKDGTNVHVKEIERSDTWAYDNVDKIDMGDGTYKGRIKKIVFELDDFSGLYTLGDCVEFGIILYDEQNPEKDVKWYVPLNLAVDFEEQKPDVNISRKAFFNEEAKAGISARGLDMDKVVADVRKVTSGEVFEKVDSYLKENCSSVSEGINYNLYYFSLSRTDGKDISESKLKYNFFTSVFGQYNHPQIYQWENDSLSEKKGDGNTTREFWNGQDGDVFEAVDLYAGLKFGYVVIVDGYSTQIKRQRTYIDDNTGISAIYHGHNGLNSNCDENTLATNTEFAVQKNNVSNVDELKKLLLENGQSSFKQLKLEESYRIALYRRSGDSKTLGAQKNGTYEDILFPKKMVENQDIYKVVYDRDTKQYVSVEKMETTEDGDYIKINAVDTTLSFGQQTKQMQLYYSAIDENYVGSRSKSQCQFFVFVGEGAAADKPSVPTSAFTYDATEKVVVPENKYYTVEGTSSAKLPGSYKVTVTLKDGYAWKDGTTDPIEFTWNIKALQTEKPVAISVLTYNGEFQTGVKAGTGYNLAGTYTAKDAGTYNAKVLLADGYEWSDGTTDALTLTWSIAKKAVAKPSAAKDLVYNGKSQTGVAVGEGYTVTGNAQTDAGDYTAVAALNKNYAWADGTTDSVKVAWSIAKKAVAKPSAAANLVYTGKVQIGVTAGKGYTVTGNTQTNAGTYAAVATLDKNHTWTNGTTAPATVQWIIAKAGQNVTAKTAFKSYKLATVKKKAQSFTIGAAADGTLTYKVTATPSKKAAKYLTVTKKGKVTVKKGAPAGTYTITVSAAETANYQAAFKEVTVKVNKTSQKVSAKVSSKTIKSKQIAKKNYAFTIGAKGKGKLTYKVTSTPKNGTKYISVNKNGKVTVKKKAPKGTYKITVTAAGNATYAKATKTITVKVK